MGFFDDIVRMADKGLKAVENGAVEKALTNGLDKLESGFDSAIEKAEKVADRPGELLSKAEEQYGKVEGVAKQAGQTVSKTIDGFKK